jgi:hypothetical protein
MSNKVTATLMLIGDNNIPVLHTKTIFDIEDKQIEEINKSIEQNFMLCNIPVRKLNIQIRNT